MSQNLGPWTQCLSEDLGPWSASALAGAGQKAALKKEAEVDPKKATQGVRDPKPFFGPWSEAHRPGTPKEARSESRSQGVRDPKPLGPWSEVSQEVGQEAPRNETSQKGRSVAQKQDATSDQSTPPKKAQRLDLTQACVIDVPNHVRGHSVPVSKKTERAKDPKAIKERYSGNGCCVCRKHKVRKAPPCHRKVPPALIV